MSLAPDLVASQAFASDDAPDADLKEPGEQPPSEIPPGSLVWHRWTVFDPRLSPRSAVVTGGILWERFAGGGGAHPGFEASAGRSIENPARPLLLRLDEAYGLRFTRDSHWVATLLRYTYTGGLMLGPVEATARFGVAFAEVHFGSGGFGLGFFCPRVSTGVAVRAGPLRAGLVAFAEYAWRWFGGPNARIEGALLELSLGGRPAGLPPWYRVEK